ncbi:MAG: ribonuclease III [Ruminococcaceae bacterium]|nr:ribonuclease III [Oscillospiraceae bacterium]
MEGLEKIIGYTYSDKELLRKALTHSSFSNEKKSKNKKGDCNERLEFLGDSILSIVVSEYLFSRYVDNQEGDLSKIRSSVVCEKALAKYAAEIGLGDYMYLGRGEELNNGRHRPSITADAFEALLASMYLDSERDMEVIRRFVLGFIKREIDFISKNSTFVDYKTMLQQIIQQSEGEKLEYVLVDETGPDHSKTFVTEARLNGSPIGKGSAGSKRESEQMAAKEALKLFGEDY